jgi:hypothetical protein
MNPVEESAELKTKIKALENEREDLGKQLRAPGLDKNLELVMRRGVDIIGTRINLHYTRLYSLPDTSPTMEFLWNRRNILLRDGVEASSASAIFAACLGLSGCTMRQSCVGGFVFLQGMLAWKRFTEAQKYKYLYGLPSNTA